MNGRDGGKLTGYVVRLFFVLYMYKITLYPAKGGRDQGWGSRVGAGLEKD